MNVLLDSVILIDHFNGRAEATGYLREERGRAAGAGAAGADSQAAAGHTQYTRLSADGVRVRNGSLHERQDGCLTACEFAAGRPRMQRVRWLEHRLA
jgi:hypothetical protein